MNNKIINDIFINIYIYIYIYIYILWNMDVIFYVKNKS